MGRELLLGSPLSVKGPSFTTSPVADPILVSRVDKNFHVGSVEDLGNLRHEVGHPVSKEIGVYQIVALNPFAA